MKKEDIKKAAEEYAKEACRPLWRAGKEQVCMVDFMEGAKWRVNAAWHNSIIRKSKFPWFPERSVQFSGKRTKRSVQKKGCTQHL